MGWEGECAGRQRRWQRPGGGGSLGPGTGPSLSRGLSLFTCVWAGAWWGGVPAASQAPGSTAGHPTAPSVYRRRSESAPAEGCCSPRGLPLKLTPGFPRLPGTRAFLRTEGPRVLRSSVPTCRRFPTPDVRRRPGAGGALRRAGGSPARRPPGPGQPYQGGLGRQPRSARAGVRPSAAPGVRGAPVSAGLTGWTHTPLCLRVLSVPC